MCYEHILFLFMLPIFQSEQKHGLYGWQFYGLNGVGDKLTLVCNISSNVKQRQNNDNI